jgi:hypothetical protein
MNRQEAGQKGAASRSEESRIQAGKKATETIKSREGDEAMAKRGAEGGRNSRGGQNQD